MSRNKSVAEKLRNYLSNAYNDLGADPLERRKKTYYQLLKKTFKTKIQTLCNISNFEIHKYLNSGYKDSWRMVF